MQTTESRDPRRVRLMFGGLARRYDLLNHLLSANLDRRWRRIAARELLGAGAGTVLDLCGGTGDLTIDLVRHGGAGTAVCCDFTRPMLVIAGEKIRKRKLDGRCLLLEADGLKLPFAANTFDAVTIGFGVRNFADLDGGFREIHRVIRPGGRMVVLEFSQPTGPVLSRAYRFYLRTILPRLGDGVSGRSAYGYLARTIGEFPDPASLAGRIRQAGFAACGWTGLSGGIVAVHTALKGTGTVLPGLDQ